MVLMDMKVSDFVSELASSSPAPGGGTIAAVNGGFAAGLGVMTCCLTLNRTDNSDALEKLPDLQKELEAAKERFIRLADEDTEAFNLVMKAFRLPRETEAEKEHRKREIALATITSTRVPMETARLSVKCCEILSQVVGLINDNVLSDCGVALECIHTAALGAFMNVSINLPGIKDEQAAGELSAELYDAKERLEVHYEGAVVTLGKRFPY